MPLALTIIWFSALILLLLAVVLATDGHFIYTLDDPYIHLRVAENILKGGYGINSDEYSAPSSSILFPVFLALTTAAGLGDKGALVINMLAMGSAVYLLGHILQDYVLPHKPDGESQSWFKFLALGLVLCIVMNAWGLVMTGLEHPLHIFTVLLLLWGFLKLQDGGKSGGTWIVLALILMPLIRFEGLALSLLGIAGLVYLRHFRLAAVAGAGIIIGFAGWGYFTQHVGLPFLPSSVQIKSAVTTSAFGQYGFGQFAYSFAKNLAYTLINLNGLILLAMMILLLPLTWKAYCKGEKTFFVLGIMAIGAGAAHMMFGQYGWFGRYEVYILIFVALVGVLLGRSRWSNRVSFTILLFGLWFTGASFADVTLLTPFASRNIYEQQYQMHRFIAEYWKQPVAVNDLGLVSYTNPNYVLDLWGLGSEQVRKAKLTAEGMTPDKMKSLVDSKAIKLVIIYDDWFLSVPANWQKMAILKTSQVVAGSDRVTFYATDAESAVQIKSLLQQFSLTLPNGAVMFFPGNAGFESAPI